MHFDALVCLRGFGGIGWNGATEAESEQEKQVRVPEVTEEASFLGSRATMWALLEAWVGGGLGSPHCCVYRNSS